jgi:ribosome-associated translation inhibitor RaiA
MEAHELSYAVAGPILKRIQEVRLERKKHPIGSEMYVALDNQVDTLLTQLTKLFTETTAIYHNKFGTAPGEIDGSRDARVSSGPNQFDLSGALGDAVKGKANLTEVDTPVETEEEEIRRKKEEKKFVDEINSLYDGGKRTRRKKSKKSKSKRRR